mmetsp:Transcript_39431/g.51605  ORF Transcript_39431/g.51605 Transcript_39431/m.51605 type:complete len:89 (-) Transcript_39431:525-791(-)
MRQTDEKGWISELVANTRKENDKLADSLKEMSESFNDKSEKIGWFERKLNKWIKNFEEAEKDAAARHNNLVHKVNEVDRDCRRESTRC